MASAPAAPIRLLPRSSEVRPVSAAATASAPSPPMLLRQRRSEARPVREAAMALAPVSPTPLPERSREVRPVREAAMALAPAAPMLLAERSSEVRPVSARSFAGGVSIGMFKRNTRPAARQSSGQDSIRSNTKAIGPTIAKCRHCSARALSSQASSSWGEISIRPSKAGAFGSSPNFAVEAGPRAAGGDTGGGAVSFTTSSTIATMALSRSSVFSDRLFRGRPSVGRQLNFFNQ